MQYPCFRPVRTRLSRTRLRNLRRRIYSKAQDKVEGPTMRKYMMLSLFLPLALSACISSSSPPPPSNTIVVPQGTAVVCSDGTQPPCR